jgi:GDP-mannose 6-dehydrogenase
MGWKVLEIIRETTLTAEKTRQPAISVFGLGYVGAVSASCLARNGYNVVGVDQQLPKVRMINDGIPPIVEAGLGEITRQMAASERLRATRHAAEAVAATNVSLICVGTPCRANGSLDLSSVVSVCEEIGLALRAKQDFHVVVVRSTVLPGTTRAVICPAIERASGKCAGVDFGIAVNPEFLREGTAIDDFYNPPKTVIGTFDERSAQAVAQLYQDIDAPLIRTSPEIAEVIKYVDNSWHALKVAFGNEVGNICKTLDIDSHQVMKIFCADTKLNISSNYLRPGFAFGGSCLPKDIRALTYEARRNDLSLPVLESILPSNYGQIERALRLVMTKQRHRIGVLGFTFKAGTDDLRESPIVELIERLLGKGFDLRLYDKNVQLGRLVGGNREYILNTIPHIARLMVDTAEEVLNFADLVLIGSNELAHTDALLHLSPEHAVVDFVRLPEWEQLGERYDGINW